MAISCCVAVEKLGTRRITCPSFTFSIEDVMVQFLDHAYSLVSVEKLHQLATKAGFELDFLDHFGRKVVPSKKSEELEFWIGLAQKKLSIAFHKETLISEGHTFPHKVDWHEIVLKNALISNTYIMVDFASCSSGKSRATTSD